MDVSILPKEQNFPVLTLSDLLRLDVEAERLIAETSHFAESLKIELGHEAA
jgi:hypothetical protein